MSTKCDICDRMADKIDICCLCGMHACPSCIQFVSTDLGLEPVCAECIDERDDQVSDDAEPITREWMIAEYQDTEITVSDECNVFLEFCTDRVWLISGCTQCSDPSGLLLAHIRTRGDLRRLIAALGWRKDG